MKIIAMYLRLSIEDQEASDESNSIVNQRLLIQEFIHENSEFMNYEIREYSDDGYSGMNFERPKMNELLIDIKRNLISCIIVKDFSRFSRDYIEMGSYLDRIFPFMGVRFISISDNYDSSRHKGTTAEIDTAFKTLLNDFYCKDISLKVKSAIGSKCANGEYAFGQTPFGYEKVPNTKNQIRINEKEAEIVRYIFELSASGLTPVAIEKKLHKENIPTCRKMRGNTGINGKQILCWSSVMVRSILTNRFYIGEFIYHKTEPISVGSRHKRHLPKSEWVTLPEHHEPIITNDLFENAGYTKTGRSTKRKHPKHPLTGKLYCGGCGFAMIYKWQDNEKANRRFECRKHSQLQIPACCTYYRADVLEELMLTLLNKELLKMADLIENKEALKIALKKRMDTLNEKIRIVERQMEELEQKKSKAYEAYAESMIKVEEYKQVVRMSNQTMDEKKVSIIRYKEDLTETEKAYLDNPGDLKHVIRYSQVSKLSQELVDAFVNKVKVYKNKSIEIEWVFSF